MNTQEEFRTMWANGLNQANEIAQHLDPEMRQSFRAALDRVVSEVGGGRWTEDQLITDLASLVNQAVEVINTRAAVGGMPWVSCLLSGSAKGRWN